jgi:hypothetical protein
MIRRDVVDGKVKLLCSVAIAKASLNRAIKSAAADAKPRDLPMARLKWG